MGTKTRALLTGLLLFLPMLAMGQLEGWHVQAMVGSPWSYGSEGRAITASVESRLFGVEDGLPGGVAFFRLDGVHSSHFFTDAYDEYGVTGASVAININMFGIQDPRRAGLVPVIRLGGYLIQQEHQNTDMFASPLYFGPRNPGGTEIVGAVFAGFRVGIPFPEPEWGGLRIELGFGAMEQPAVRLEAEMHVRLWRGLSLAVSVNAQGVLVDDDVVYSAPAPDQPDSAAGSVSGNVDMNGVGWGLLTGGLRYQF